MQITQAVTVIKDPSGKVYAFISLLRCGFVGLLIYLVGLKEMLPLTEVNYG